MLAWKQWSVTADRDAVALYERCIQMGDAPSKYTATEGCGTYLPRISLAEIHIANGEIKVIVEKTLPLFRAPEALEMSRRGHVHGKIVLTVNDQDACHPEFHQAAVEKSRPQPLLVD